MTTSGPNQTRRRQTVEEWISALERMGLKVAQHGSYYMSQCPAHEDDTPSLRIKERGDGDGASIDCYAGCDFTDILKAVGFYGQGGGSGDRRPEPRRAQPKPAEEVEPKPLPSGPAITLYRYLRADRSTAFVISRRDKPGGGKTFAQWLPTDDPNLWLPKGPGNERPLYGLPIILGTDGRVIVVEGEKCVHVVNEAWPKTPVTCWAGGTNAWRLTDWTPLAGREVQLIADADPYPEPPKAQVSAGHKAMEALAAHLHGLGCTVQIALPPPEWDNDIADWIQEQGAKAAGKIVRDLLRPYEPPPDASPSPTPVAPLDDDYDDDDDRYTPDEVRDNPHYRLIGLDDLNFVFWLKIEGRLHTVTRNKITRGEELIAIAPDVFWRNMASTEKLDAAVCRAIGDTITRTAANLGQVDHARNVERGAVKLPDGKVAFHLGDRVLLDGREIELTDNTDKLWLSGPRIDLGSGATDAQVKDVARAVLDYRWSTRDDGRRFLGWMVAAMVGGALDWRPHLWLTAPGGAGKTWLFEQVLLKIMQGALATLADATPASVARLTGNSALPIGIDEAEPSHDWVINLLPTLRVAASGVGERVRADSHGGVIRQSPRYAAILSSTIAPSLAKPDASRITEIGLSSEGVDNWPQVRRSIVSALRHADAIRYKMIRDAQSIVDAATTLAADMQDMGMDSRESLASSALTAGWRWWGLDDREIMSHPGTSERTDAGDALLEILAIRYQAPGVASVSVADMLTDIAMTKPLSDLYGIQRKMDEIWIAERHQGLRSAMSRTKWAQADLRKLLLQLPGAMTTQNPVRYGSLRTRAIIIPAETLAEIGVDLSVEALPQSEPPPEHVA